MQTVRLEWIQIFRNYTVYTLVHIFLLPRRRIFDTHELFFNEARDSAGCKYLEKVRARERDSEIEICVAHTRVYIYIHARVRRTTS